MIIYSSNMQNFLEIYNKIELKYKVLAIDLYQQRVESNDNIINLTSNMNTLLKIVQRFNIYDIPSAFIIEKQNNFLYKQDSSIEILKI
ncbi:MAG: hypothetical protein HXX81_05645 [Campylobacterales bacterium]|nr:hypothetical protein [Campylobacterales bacterium]